MSNHPVGLVCVRLMSRETHKLTAPMVKQEEASKYRCKECNKLFKAPEFVVKHITTKHGETIKAKLDEVSQVLSYIHLELTV